MIKIKARIEYKRLYMKNPKIEALPSPSFDREPNLIIHKQLLWILIASSLR